MTSSIDGPESYLESCRKKYDETWNVSERNHNRIIALLSSLADNPHLLPDVTFRVESIMREEVLACAAEMGHLIDAIRFECEFPVIPSAAVSVLCRTAREYGIEPRDLFATRSVTPQLYAAQQKLAERLGRMGYYQEELAEIVGRIRAAVERLLAPEK